MVQNLIKGTVLFHGSYCEVQKPELAKCRKFKDFGQGLYLTTDIAQAEKFAITSLKRAKKDGLVTEKQKNAFVTCYTYNPTENDNVMIFKEADVDWLHCIVAHRKKNSFPEIIKMMKEYDIIGGKIANDATNATIIAYIAGTFGETGSSVADEICIRLLLPERLKNQYCFRTEQSLSHLVFEGSRKVYE